MYLSDKADKESSLQERRCALEEKKFEEDRRERLALRDLERERFEEEKRGTLVKDKRLDRELSIREAQVKLEADRMAAEKEERASQAALSSKKDDLMFGLMQRMMDKLC